MCGITGFVDLARQTSSAQLKTTASRMAITLYHRGPDDSGTWVDEQAGVALSFRRLSIIDLSPAGHQPMESVCGRYVVVFNGEIYNFKTLRHELEAVGQAFRGHSDTEVMLAAISHWGIQAALERFNGMFAFAVWDRHAQRLYLARDRLGEKPLYYGRMGNTFLFGSELSALRAHPAFQAEVDRDALALFLRHNCVPAPYSIYRRVHKLPPATLLALDTRESAPAPNLESYWSAKDVAERGSGAPFSGPADEAIDRLDRLLRDAVKLRMEADVPLGVFLSGGIDSSAVVALMQAQSERAVKTFSIGFADPAYNEAEHARAVAQHLGTDHTELYVTPSDMLAVIPRLPEIYDEPFADSSQIPTFLVSALARRHVTVSLSGDGGDELFGGYNRYVWGRNLWQRVGWMPRPLAGVAANALTAVSPDNWDAMFRTLDPVLPAAARQRNPGDKLHKLAEILAVDSPETMYLGLASHWKDPGSVVLRASEPPTALTARNRWARLDDFTLRMMYLDTVTYLPDDILVKVDRASMAVSLEVRVPLLDPRVVEFAWQVPLAMKVRNGTGKWLLRQVLYRYVPSTLIERPKMGFGGPLESWLRGPLRDWGEALLAEPRLREDGFFEPVPIRQKWQEHQEGKRNWQYHLWDVLMFQAWLEHQKSAIA
jgi:asparagine synthase (glutamine-hydrolysing)